MFRPTLEIVHEIMYSETFRHFTLITFLFVAGLRIVSYDFFNFMFRIIINFDGTS